MRRPVPGVRSLRVLGLSVALLFGSIGSSYAADPPQNASSAPDASPAPNGQRWRVTQEVLNQTPYVLRTLSTMITEQTSWQRKPATEIGPHGGDTHSIESQAMGHGLALLVTYGAYDAKTNAFVGMLVARSGIDCTVRARICGDWHRWVDYVIDTDDKAGIEGHRGDNTGSPTDFQTTVQFVRKPGPAPRRARAAASSKMPVPPRGNPNGTWNVAVELANDSPFTVSPRALWNSEGTGWPTPPPFLKPKQQGLYFFNNSEWAHGAASLVVYRVTDPNKGNKYVGTAVIQVALDCPAVLPDKGCMGSAGSATVAADAVPGYGLAGGATGTALPVFYAPFVTISGGYQPIPPH